MENALEEIGPKEKYQETIFKVQGREILFKIHNKGRSSEYKEEREPDTLQRGRTDRAQVVIGYGGLTEMSLLTRKDTSLGGWGRKAMRPVWDLLLIQCLLYIQASIGEKTAFFSIQYMSA